MVGNSNFWKSRRVQEWLYNTSSVFVLFFFVGFSAVLPIDAISQASQSTNNYALNTFVVVGALVLFGITAAFITSARIYIRKTQLQDIPKRYVPLDENDLPKSCYIQITENFQRCEEIRKKAMFVNESIKHPGLSNPNSTLLPPLLSFEDVVRSVGMKLKWDRNLVGTEISIPANLSFREIVAYIENKLIGMKTESNKEFVELYEDLRYSGKLITEEKFVRFMELSIEFVKNTRFSINDENEELESRRDRGGSFLYTPSVLSKSTMDALSTYSIKDRSKNRISSKDNNSIIKTNTDGSQSVSFYDDKSLPPDMNINIDDFNDPLYRPDTYSSISSTATTARHYGL